eukprot:859468-Amphidinium_carterae.1
MTKVVKKATESRSQQKAQFEHKLGRLCEAGKQEHAARAQAEQTIRSMQEAGDRRCQELDSEARHLKEQCDTWMMQMKSIARAFTLSGTVKLEDVEWHHGRHELFDVDGSVC